MQAATQKSISLASGYKEAVPTTGNQRPTAPPTLLVEADKPCLIVGAGTAFEKRSFPNNFLKKRDAGEVPFVATHYSP